MLGSFTNQHDGVENFREAAAKVSCLLTTPEILNAYVCNGARNGVTDAP